MEKRVSNKRGCGFLYGGQCVFKATLDPHDAPGEVRWCDLGCWGVFRVFWTCVSGLPPGKAYRLGSEMDKKGLIPAWKVSKRGPGWNVA